MKSYWPTYILDSFWSISKFRSGPFLGQLYGMTLKTTLQQTWWVMTKVSQQRENPANDI